MNNNTSNSYNPEIPPFQGDYAKAVFLSVYVKPFKLHDNNEYARYLTYEYGIKDVNAYHNSLFTEGYIIEASASECYMLYTNDELKNLLLQLGQATKGKKEQLIASIMTNASEQFIHDNCPKNVYILSEKGHSFILEHEHCIKLHKYMLGSLSEYKKYHVDGQSFYDTMKIMLNKWIYNDKRNQVYNGYIQLSQSYADDNDKEQALEMLLKGLYIKLSGLSGYNYFKLYHNHSCREKELKELFEDIIQLPTNNIVSVVKYRDIYDNSLVDDIYKQELPICICDKQLFIYIINSMLDGTYNEETIQKKLKRAFNKAIDESSHQGSFIDSNNSNTINIQSDNHVRTSDKNKGIALLLCITLGYLGIHHFYVGKTGLGILYLFTGGLFAIGWLVDIYKIATGSFTDNQGAKLK